MTFFIKNNNFINTYEKRIKDYREEYYRYIAANKNSVHHVDFALISSIISLVILFIFGFTIKGLIITIISIIVTTFIFNGFAEALNLKAPNNYIREIRRLGFPTISIYESFLKSYLTGDKGYYEKVLNDIKKEYNISDDMPKIRGASGEIYYIWLNSKQDVINLLNSNTLFKPEIISIRMNNIRYYRVDETTKTILLKTDIEYYRFDISALEILNEIMKSKRFDNLKVFNPEEYINDFEIYVHHFIQSQKTNTSSYNRTNFDNELNKLVFYTITLIISSALYFVTSKTFIQVFSIIIIIFLNYIFASLINTKNTHAVGERNIIKMLNEDDGCIERFLELKVALGIKDTYDKIYSKDNACYYTWVANGYFHVFLNIIYTDVMYMAVKVSDVEYYRRTYNECIIKLKDKTLEFRRDAKKVFDKILPNRDYDWLKGYQQR